MAEHPHRRPRFAAGDHVQVTVPGAHSGKHGVVAEIINPRTGDFVYRYRVQFPDNTSALFFGFELQAAFRKGQSS